MTAGSGNEQRQLFLRTQAEIELLKKCILDEILPLYVCRLSEIINNRISYWRIYHLSTITKNVRKSPLDGAKLLIPATQLLTVQHILCLHDQISKSLNPSPSVHGILLFATNLMMCGLRCWTIFFWGGGVKCLKIKRTP